MIMADQEKIMGRIKKGDSGEIRISLKTFNGKDYVRRASMSRTKKGVWGPSWAPVIK